VNTLQTNLQENILALKKQLSSEDILTYSFSTQDNVPCALIYADGMVNKQLLGELVARPISFLSLKAAVKDGQNTKNDGGRVAMKYILRLSLPVTVGSILIPLSSLIDSVFAVRLLSAYTSDAVSLYGLFSGGAVTVINLPVSICYGVAAASIPAVATAKAQAERIQTGQAEQTKKSVKNTVRRKWLFSLFITVVISLPAAVGLYCFAEPIAKIIYKSLSANELSTLSKLIRSFSVSAFTLSCAQTLSACLTAQGRPLHSAFSMGFGMAVKTAVYAVLLKNPQTSVFGLAYATNIGYLVAFLLDLLYNFLISKDIRKGSVKSRKINFS
jgi:stage V sporulation protein B